MPCPEYPASLLLPLNVIDLSGATPVSRVRLQLGLLLAAAVTPFMLILVMAYFWVYQPLQDEVRLLSRDIETRFEGVARLQVALVRSAMPVNDYLIHGHEAERREYQLLIGRVEAAFALLRGSIDGVHKQELDHVASLYSRWQRASRQGESILTLDAQARRTPQAAMAMESFDANLDRLVDESDDLLDHVRKELGRSRDQLELRRERLTWFVTLSTLVATMITLATVMYLSQRVIRPLASRIDEEDVV